MNRAQILTERVISSRLHTEMLFDEVTTEQVAEILQQETRKLLGKNVQSLLEKPVPEQDRLVRHFAQNLVPKLKQVPHFLYNRINFDTQPVGDQFALFGTGYQHTFFTIVTILINTALDPKIWVEAYETDFGKEIMRLRSVVRHELAHRLHMEKIHPDPVKRWEGRKFKNAATAPPLSHHYYGMPTELIAHANHTIELIRLGHERAWKETLANYALTDPSPGFSNTKKFVRLVAKLSKEYGLPLAQRMRFRRELLKLARKMRVSAETFGGDMMKLSTRNKVLEIDTDPATVRSLRLNKEEVQ